MRRAIILIGGTIVLILGLLGFALVITYQGLVEQPDPCKNHAGVYLYSDQDLKGDFLFFDVGDHDIPKDFLAKSLLECPNGAYHVEVRDHTNRPGGWDCSTNLSIDWRNEGGKAVSIKVEKHSALKKDCIKYP